MNLIFAGTPDFALPSLVALHQAGHRIVSVYTQPDRPAGRGRKLGASPVKEFAVHHGLSLKQPQTLRGHGDAIANAAIDVMVVVAYGLILPPEILAAPKIGCLNVHASLLPRWRGPAPIPRAIAAGDTVTGVSIMRMDAGIDTGPVYAQARIPIATSDTSAGLEHKLAQLGAKTLADVLALLDGIPLIPAPQENDAACYARKLEKHEAIIDWSQPASVLHRKIRALNPRPVAVTHWRQARLKIWNVAPLDDAASANGAEPGTIVSADASAIRVATGAGVLCVTLLQAEAGKALTASQFLNGHRVSPGDRFF